MELHKYSFCTAFVHLATGIWPYSCVFVQCIYIMYKDAFEGLVLKTKLDKKDVLRSCSFSSWCMVTENWSAKTNA